MAYPVDNIIPVNLILTPGGLGYADFSSAFVFANTADLKTLPAPPQAMVKPGKIKVVEKVIAEGEDNALVTQEDAQVVFPVDTFRDYGNLTELAADFSTASDIYLIATRYFAQVPRPAQITVWMKNPADKTLLETVNKATEEAWRYHYFFKHADLTDPNVLSLSDWSDAAEHPVWFTTSAANITDGNVHNDIASQLAAKGNRHMFVGYKLAASVTADPSQAYAMVQLAAAFNKFKPLGINTAITGEYQVLPGVSGDSLKTSGYNALKTKKAVFFTEIELAGQTDACRVINSRSMSSYDEFIDDVINLDVLKNSLQVDGYNYIANVGTKRALTPREYGGLLSCVAATCKRFYDNGVLGEGTYVDQESGETKVASFGFVINSKPEDVLSLTASQRKKRYFPPTSVLVILARAGHVAEINVTVE